jgi:hypothetical protein
MQRVIRRSSKLAPPASLVLLAGVDDAHKEGLRHLQRQGPDRLPADTVTRHLPREKIAAAV